MRLTACITLTVLLTTLAQFAEAQSSNGAAGRGSDNGRGTERREARQQRRLEQLDAIRTAFDRRADGLRNAGIDGSDVDDALPDDGPDIGDFDDASNVRQDVFPGRGRRGPRSDGLRSGNSTAIDRLRSFFGFEDPSPTDQATEASGRRGRRADRTRPWERDGDLRPDDDGAADSRFNPELADRILAKRLADIDHLRDVALANGNLKMLDKADQLEQIARWQHARRVGAPAGEDDPGTGVDDNPDSLPDDDGGIPTLPPTDDDPLDDGQLPDDDPPSTDDPLDDEFLELPPIEIPTSLEEEPETPLP